MHVELVTSDGHEIADACEALNAAGWAPTFVVPMGNHTSASSGTVTINFQVIASRPRKSVNPPPLPGGRGPYEDLKGPPRVPPHGPPRPKKPL